jgi:methylenetetrahydrofolate reductase (NADPH)
MAKNVFDVDSIQELLMFKTMRDEKKVWGADALTVAPALFLGAAENPFANPFEFRVRRLAKKVLAGADIIQTQVIYDIDRFEKFMEEVHSHKLEDKVHIMGGVTPLKSAKVARYMKTKVAGIMMPDGVISRMEKAQDPKAEGIKICIETVKHLRTMKGVHGVHVMAIAWEETRRIRFRASFTRVFS